MTQPKQNFRLKVSVNGKTITNTLLHSKRRFILKLGTINWQNRPSVYVRINYGYFLDNFGKKQMFYNDGIYDDKNDLIRAVKAFTEEL